ncbi:hypothetical protein J4G37_10975 [Microvirga sp. 3-52]|nr:hypothetical protein [Microvirga sp. 3-52]
MEGQAFRSDQHLDPSRYAELTTDQAGTFQHGRHAAGNPPHAGDQA